MKNVICHDIVDAIIHFRSLSDVMDHPMLKLAFSILTTGISDSERLGVRETQKKNCIKTPERNNTSFSDRNF